MRRMRKRAGFGTPGTFLVGSAVVMSFSALALGLWNTGQGVGSAGLMSIDSRPAAAAMSATSAARPVVDAVVPQPEPTPPMDMEAEVEVEAEPEADVTSASDGPMFDGRPLRPVRQMEMTVTAYSPDEQSCGEWADGWTASGYSVWTNGMKLVAADTSLLPFGTVVTIPGYNNGQPVQVLDVGGAIKGNRLDVLYPTHHRALQWGVQRLEITVWEYAD